jgi:integrase
VAVRKRTRNRLPPEPTAELPLTPMRANTTVGEFARQWLKGRGAATRQADNQRLRDHFLPLLGAKRLRDLNTEDVALAVRQMLAKKGMNVKSARNAYAVFSDLVSDALGLNLVAADPRDLPEDIWPPEAAASVPRFSPAEARALMVDERLDPDQRVFNALCFHSGLESEEVCQLRWSDWASRVRSPLVPELGAILEAWREGGFERVYGRPPTAEDWLVPRRSDVTQPHTEGSSYKAFRRACVALGIKVRSPRAVVNTFGVESASSSV